MLHFVILIHDHPHLHWDLLLEQEGQETLRTWRLEKPPASGEIIKAEALPEHRLLYLDYEGPVSRERGRVVRWDHGPAEWLSDGEFAIRLRLNGQRLIGEVTLDREALQPLWSATP